MAHNALVIVHVSRYKGFLSISICDHNFEPKSSGHKHIAQKSPTNTKSNIAKTRRQNIDARITETRDDDDINDDINDDTNDDDGDNSK